MKNFLNMLLTTLLLCSGVATAHAQEIYMTQDDFVSRHTSAKDNAKSLWIMGGLRTVAENILDHRPYNLRQRYWQTAERTIWVLEEIGKEEPITAGFAIENGRIVDAQVLVFRESRGWEIHYPTFTAQFADARMTAEDRLDRSIDGISGATLSVNAMRKMARLALAYDRHVQGSTSAQDTLPQPGESGS